MIRPLVRADFFGRRESATVPDVRFWLCELRTPELLVAVAASHPEKCRRLVPERELLVHALRGDASVRARTALATVESKEREAYRRYWEPLRSDIEKLQHMIRIVILQPSPGSLLLGPARHQRPHNALPDSP